MKDFINTNLLNLLVANKFVLILDEQNEKKYSPTPKSKYILSFKHPYFKVILSDNIIFETLNLNEGNLIQIIYHTKIYKSNEKQFLEYLDLLKKKNQ